MFDPHENCKNYDRPRVKRANRRQENMPGRIEVKAPRAGNGPLISVHCELMLNNGGPVQSPVDYAVT